MVFDFLMYLIVGGLGTITGPIVGTMLITFLTQFLQSLQEYRMLIFGPILTLLVIFYPSGIVGAISMFRMKYQEKRRLKRETANQDDNEVKGG